MKRNNTMRLLLVFCMCFVMLLTFSACKDDEIYAETSDFESYPDYWNDFNDDTPNHIYVPNDQDTTSNPSGTQSDDANSSEEDWTANLDDDDDTSSDVDTDKDGTPDDKDSDDDNDGTTDDKDPDDDNDGVRDEDEEENKDKNDYGNQGPFVPFN